MKYLYLSLLFLLLAACSQKLEDGHYHVVYHSIYEPQASWHTIDFEGNTAIINKTFLSGITLFKEEGKYLANLPHSWFIELNPFFRNDSLYLFDAVDSTEIYIEKCEEGCCSKEADFFAEARINVELPFTKDTLQLVSYRDMKLSLCNPITVGWSKYENAYGASITPILDCDGRVCRVEDLELYLEKFEIGVAENLRQNISWTLFIDKEVPIKKVSEIVNELHRLGENKIYIALKSSDNYENFQIWLKLLTPEVIFPENEENWNEWLNNQQF